MSSLIITTTVNPAQYPSLFASDQNPLTKAASFKLLLQHQVVRIKVAEELVMAHEGLVQSKENLTVSLAATSSRLDNSTTKTTQSMFLWFEASYMEFQVNKNPKLYSLTTCPSIIYKLWVSSYS